MSPARLFLVVVALAGFAEVARAYEYPLQFTPNSGYRSLVVAGYGFEGDEVVGNCSYRTAASGSGRGGGHASRVQIHEQSCRWDLYGNLLRVTPGAPAVPTPLYTKGTKTVYAASANGGYTGTDSKIPGGGFVSTPGSHYSWLTPNAHAVIPQNQSVYSTVITLQSDGDGPLDITALDATSLKGSAAIETTTCLGQIQPNTTCSITVVCDFTKLTTPSGLAYDTLRIAMKSDAGAGHDFIQSYTIDVPKEGDHD
jgi:hypothetical protein